MRRVRLIDSSNDRNSESGLEHLGPKQGVVFEVERSSALDLGLEVDQFPPSILILREGGRRNGRDDAHGAVAHEALCSGGAPPR